jgi:tetrahydromethanopterin S-methyltransferase subunit G
MKENEFEERFDRLETRLQEGLAQVASLIDSLATLCAREFAAISEHFTQVDKRLDDIEDKIEAFAHRVDFEVEERHKLGERISKLERSHR